MRISSRVVPSAATENACVWPRVNTAEPWTRGATPTSIADGADLVGGTAVGALLVDGDARRMMLLLELVERHLRAARLSLVASASRRRRRAPRGPRSSTALVASWRSSLSLDLGRLGRGPCRTSALSSLEQIASSTCGASTSHLGLPAFSASSRCAAQSFLISPWAMSRASRIVSSATSLAPASTIRIASSVPATTRSRRRLECPPRRVDDEVAVLVLADAHGADRARERDVGHHQRGAGAVHREDVVGVRRGRPTSGSRRAGSHGASPWGRAAGSAGRSCARSGCPSRRRDPRA